MHWNRSGIGRSEHPGTLHLGPKLRHSGTKRKADTDLEDSTVKSWQAGSEDPRISEVGQREVPGPQQQQDSKLVGVDDTVGVEPVHEKSYGDKESGAYVRHRPGRSGISHHRKE